MKKYLALSLLLLSLFCGEKKQRVEERKERCVEQFKESRKLEYQFIGPEHTTNGHIYVDLKGFSKGILEINLKGKIKEGTEILLRKDSQSKRARVEENKALIKEMLGGKYAIEIFDNDNYYVMFPQKINIEPKEPYNVKEGSVVMRTEFEVKEIDTFLAGELNLEGPFPEDYFSKLCSNLKSFYISDGIREYELYVEDGKFGTKVPSGNFSITKLKWARGITEIEEENFFSVESSGYYPLYVKIPRKPISVKVESPYEGWISFVRLDQKKFTITSYKEWREKCVIDKISSEIPRMITLRLLPGEYYYEFWYSAYDGTRGVRDTITIFPVKETYLRMPVDAGRFYGYSIDEFVLKKLDEGSREKILEKELELEPGSEHEETFLIENKEFTYKIYYPKYEKKIQTTRWVGSRSHPQFGFSLFWDNPSFSVKIKIKDKNIEKDTTLDYYLFRYPGRFGSDEIGYCWYRGGSEKIIFEDFELEIKPWVRYKCKTESDHYIIREKYNFIFETRPGKFQIILNQLKTPEVTLEFEGTSWR